MKTRTVNDNGGDDDNDDDNDGDYSGNEDSSNDYDDDDELQPQLSQLWRQSQNYSKFRRSKNDFDNL